MIRAVAIGITYFLFTHLFTHPFVPSFFASDPDWELEDSIVKSLPGQGVALEDLEQGADLAH